MIEVTNNRDVEETMSGFTRITARRKNGDWVYVYANSHVQAKRVRTLLFKLARRFKELTMLDIANLADEVAEQQAEERLEEFEQLKRNAEVNAERLRHPLPVAELLSIWKSTAEDFRTFMMLCPEERQRIEAELAEREKVMQRLLAKMERAPGSRHRARR